MWDYWLYLAVLFLKIRALDAAFGKKEIEYQSKISRYEHNLKDKETSISRLETKLQEQTMTSEQMIERIRVQAEENSNRVFQELTVKVRIE